MAAAAWTGVIYATIPLARTIQSLVADSIGRSWFTYGVLTALACAAAAAAWPLRMTGSNVAW